MCAGTGKQQTEWVRITTKQEHFYDPAYIQDQTRFMIDLLKNYTDEK